MIDVLDPEKIETTIAHEGRRRMFLDIYQYDPVTAWRYFHLVCKETESSRTRDRDCILQVLPTNEGDAISIFQIRALLLLQNPFYNNGGLSRHLDRLVELELVEKHKRNSKLYLYWRRLEWSITAKNQVARV